MIQIKLLKDYQDHQAGDTIDVSNNVAYGLYEKGIARKPMTKDSFVKSEMGETKAFKKAPSKSSFEAKKKSEDKDSDLVSLTEDTNEVE